jgi:TRAP-type mannitol/chloroaromatic compound transport system permease large subunit
MAHFIAENMAPIMFASLVVFLLLGYPVAFSLGACGLVFFIVGVELAPFSGGTINLSWPLLQSLPERIYGTMNNDVLLAIPFFTLMGLILERSGMAEDLLDTIGQLFGTIRGGLAYAVIFVGALLAATTGVVAASVISMGLISLPIMMRYGYDRRVASGVIAASGTLAQIIPPSLVLIVLADQLGRSVGDMYEGAFIPGLVLASLYAVYIFLVSTIYPAAAPGLPKDAIGYREPNGARGLWSLLVLTLVSGFLGYYVMRQTTYNGADFVILTMAVGITFAFTVAVLNFIIGKITGFRFLSTMAQQVTFVMVPPLFLIFLVLGTIFIGVATPTEGGAMGATGALLLAAFKRYLDRDPNRFNFALLRSAVESTAKLSAFVVFILVGARIFSLTFYGVNGHVWVEHLLISMPGGMYGFLAVVNLAVFLLAFFLDFFELAFIIIPLLKPAAESIFRVAPEAVAIAKSFDMSVITERGREVVSDVAPFMIWFGVLLGVNMQTSFMHPPFGFALFYLRSVAPKEAYRDKVTGKLTDPITTGQIYWGAVPFVIIQCIMVGILMFSPWMVMHYYGTGPKIDPSKVEINIPTFGGPGGLPGLGTSPFGAPPNLGGPPPGLGGPPPGLSGPPPGLTPPPAMPGLAPTPAIPGLTPPPAAPAPSDSQTLAPPAAQPASAPAQEAQPAAPAVAPAPATPPTQEAQPAPAAQPTAPAASSDTPAAAPSAPAASDQQPKN